MAARGEAIVREHIGVLDLGDNCTVDAIEVSANDEQCILYLLPPMAMK